MQCYRRKTRSGRRLKEKEGKGNNLSFPLLLRYLNYSCSRQMVAIIPGPSSTLFVVDGKKERTRKKFAIYSSPEMGKHASSYNQFYSGLV